MYCEQRKKMEGVTHHYVSLKTGVRLHFVEWTETTSTGRGSQASGALQLPPLVLCHGWPDFWFTWRHQAPTPLVFDIRIFFYK